MRSLTAFRETFLASDSAHADVFESLDARRMRYAIYWAMYESNVYRRVHNFSTSMKHTYALGKHIRSLYNPANRIGNFYAAHLWGGPLSATAAMEWAIPIATESEELRASVAHLWKQSNFASLKDVITLRGSIEGDIVARVNDNVKKEVVTLERLDPGTVVALALDSLGNCKGYTIEEARPDPSNKARTVTYTEEVSRDGDYVKYATFLNNKPYAWAEDQPAEWEVPYGFVPLVHWAHSNVGLDFGWSELHPMRSKVMECDDLATMISDQIRKAVNPLWLMKGMKATTLTTTGAQRDETGGADSRPAPGREELKAIWDVPKDADAKAMLANLNLKDALQHLDGLLKELERDYPELQTDIWATGATSGRALRVARQRVEAKVLQRREGYDAGLVKLQMMAVAIGGYRGYEGYSGFDLDSYAKGDLDHTIAPRPVFTPDPMDAVEISQAQWAAAKVAVEAGADLAGYLKSQGLDDEAIAELVGVQDEIDD